MKTTVVLLVIGLFQLTASADNRVIPLMEGEQFWGGCVTDGRAMPFRATNFERDLHGDTRGNQAQPLLISNKGRYVWCDEPFEFKFDDQSLTVQSGSGEVEFGKAGDSLRDAYRHVSRTYFPSTGEMPDEMLFIKPQYNTWIELIYDQREDRIRQYADDILANGFPAGVLMIDDNWQEDYGVWEFHPGRFQDPKEMMRRLHDQGFKVMLWICPYFSPDCETFRLLNKKGYFLKDKRGGTYICKWWNGYSASLDLTNPEAVKYFQGRLSYLVDEYGVDGFKLDAGDARAYKDPNIKAREAISPNEFSKRWAALGLPFKLNEYRACWKLAGQALAQRLRDKGHNWQDLQQLIPDALAQGLMGYAFMCPDMIGGGEYSFFYNDPDKPLDQELIVRSAQCSALMPMMQFSVAPWRVCTLTPGNIDTSGDVWEYRVDGHKTEHHDRSRKIFIGPDAQKILRLYLARPDEQVCFSMAESLEQRRNMKAASRITPLSCGNRRGKRSMADRKPSESFRQSRFEFHEKSYYRAVQYACDAAFPAPPPLGQLLHESNAQKWKKSS